MSSLEPLRFLRPYLSLPLLTGSTAYLRLYRCTRENEAIYPTLRRSVSSLGNNTHKKNGGVPGGEDIPAFSSHAIAARVQELSEANALSYPRIRPRTDVMRIPDFRKKYKNISASSPGQDVVSLCGRLHSVRRSGSKLVFLDLMAEFERVQALCNFRSLESSGITVARFKEITKLLKRGDLVSITGTPTRTPTGELTIQATNLPELLSPSLVPLPEILVDEDTRIRHRHMDFLVNPQSVEVLRLRSHIIKYMRDFFHDREFLEFQTPILANHAGGAAARPFLTTATDISAERPLALRIAPELWLKRLVVGGVDRVFELGPAFRNEGIDPTHNPEFTMCEFYSAYTSLSGLVRLTEELVAGLASHCHDLITSKLGSLPAIEPHIFAAPFPMIEFIPSLEAALGFKLPDLQAVDALETLYDLLDSRGLAPPASEARTLPKLLDRLASSHLEPGPTTADGSHTKPLFITHHPACMSPLAKSFVCPRTGQLVSARAELFAGGRELANMYEEENDPFAQRSKFLDQVRARTRVLRLRHSGQKEDEPQLENNADNEDESVVDESYVQALESGLPPTGGWGCGVERLVMLFSGARRISDCLSFGNLRNVVGLSAVPPSTLRRRPE
ncbi:hypothetical protein VTK73DRAFT_7172 [Phialemonium thermophilum]|uniref:Lysyl-tRNA synthetase n=1 Tax=Phialemonium thermophilum TaxID=223376 RepID=A0ABR3XUG3_9PEZI